MRRSRRRNQNRRLAVAAQVLEERTLLAADLIFDADAGHSSAKDDGAADTFVIDSRDDNLEVYINDELVFQGSAHQVDSLQIIGSSDQDLVQIRGIDALFSGNVAILDVDDVKIADRVDLRGGEFEVRASKSVNLLAGGAIVSARGNVILDAGATGTLILDGAVNVSSLSPESNAGSIHLLGGFVGLQDDAVLAANGASGGTILVGGDYQGLNAEIPNSQRIFVSQQANLSANAMEDGNGGKIIVWSDEVTRFHGSITAQGKGEGAGGFVEISGKEYLALTGSADVTAENGATGTILLDPRDGTIVASGANDSLIQDGALNFAEPDASTDVTISASALTSLDGNVVFNVSRDLFIDAALNFSNQTNGESVTFRAGRNLDINANVQTAGGSISFVASDSGGVNDANSILRVDSAVGSSSTGDVTFVNDGSQGIYLNADVTSAGDITFQHAVTMELADVTLTGNDVTFASTLDNAPVDVGTRTGGALTLGDGTHSINTDNGRINGVVSPGFDGTAFNFTDISVSAGAVLNITGSQPLILLGTGVVNIAGDIDVSGGDGGVGGIASPTAPTATGGGGGGSARGGGGAGGGGGGRGISSGNVTGGQPSQSGFGPGGGGTGEGGGGGGHLTTGGDGASTSGNGGSAYASLPPLVGGSGGGGGIRAGLVWIGGGGGGGGGAVQVVGETLIFSGSIDASGGDGGIGNINAIETANPAGGGGSGGAIDLFGVSSPNNTGTLDVSGGLGGTSGGGNAKAGGDGSDGRKSVRGGAIRRNSLTINTIGNGRTTFGGAVGSNAALDLITTNADGVTEIYGSVTTIGIQQYNDNVEIGGGVTLSSLTDNIINFASDVNSTTANANSLTINSTDLTTFHGMVGNSRALESITTDATGTVRFNGGVVASSGDQNYQNTIILGADTIFRGNDVSFSGAVDSASGLNHSLTVNTSGNGVTTLGGVIGAADALSYITTNADGSTVIVGAITVTGSLTFHDDVTLETDVATPGSQTYNDSVTLSTDIILTSAAGGDIVFGSTVDGAHVLTVNSGGTTRFSGHVGNTTALNSLITDASGTTEINGGSISTTSDQSYFDTLFLGSNTTLTGRAITFGNTLNSTSTGSYSLTTLTPSLGFTAFEGNGTVIKPLAAFTSSVDGLTQFNDGILTTVGTQVFRNPVQVTGDNIINGSSVTFQDTLDSGPSVGDGTGGALNLTKHTSINTDTGEIDGVVSPAWNGSVFQFTDITIPAGINLNASGSKPLILLATGTVDIDGGINANGGAGGWGGKDRSFASGGIAGPGGFAGGQGSDLGFSAGQAGFGPGGGSAGSFATGAETHSNAGGGGGSHTTVGGTGGTFLTPFGQTFTGGIPGTGGPTYDSTIPFVGGSGGGGGSGQVADGTQYPYSAGQAGGGGGGGGGGAIRIRATTIDVTGYVSARGGDGGRGYYDGIQGGNGGGGAGGTIELIGVNTPMVSGALNVSGGTSIKNTAGGTGGLGRRLITGGLAPRGGLTINTSGNGVTEFQDLVGSIGSLNFLTTNGDGITKIDLGRVKTVGTQTYGDSVQLPVDAILTGSSVQFLSTVNPTGGGHSLQILGSAVFGDGGEDAAGGVTAFTTVTVSGATTFNSTATVDVVTTGRQIYSGNVILDGDTTVQSAGNANIRFDGKADGAAALLVQTAGTTTFSGPVGATTPLSSVTVDLAGITWITGGQVSTTGIQVYTGPVNLGTNTLLSGNDVTLTGGIDGHGLDLSLNFAQETVVDAGVYKNIRNFATGGGGNTRIDTDFTTTGVQTYFDTVTLNDDITLTGANVAFDNTINNATATPQKLTVLTGNNGTKAFQGDVGLGTNGAIQSLDTGVDGITRLGGTITTIGSQGYSPVLIVDRDSALITTNSIVSFGGTIDSKANFGNDLTISTGNASILFPSTVGDSLNGELGALTLNTTGTTTFSGSINAESVTTNAGGITYIAGGAVTTTGDQTYNDVVILADDTVLTGNDETFAQAINAAGFDLTLNFAAQTNVDSAIIRNVKNLTTGGGGTTLIDSDFTTTGTQSYFDDVLLTTDATLTATMVTLGSAVDSSITNRALQINGAAQIGNGGSAAVGSVLALQSFAVTGETTFNSTATSDVQTVAEQTYSGDVSLLQDTTIESVSGDVTFGGTLNGCRSLNVSAGKTLPGDSSVIFGSSVGVTTALSGLIIESGGAFSVDNPINTSGPISITAVGTLPVNAPITSNNSTIALTADQIHLGSQVNAGAGNARIAARNGGTISDGSSTPDIIAGTATFEGNVSPGQSPGIMDVAGNVALADGDTLTVEIGGISPGTSNSSHDQVNGSGDVNIGNNVTLSLSAINGFVPVVGNQFVIISRAGGSGTFNKLPQGSVIKNFLGSGLDATLNYAGGDGNDVVLEVRPPSYDFSMSNYDVMETDSNYVTNVVMVQRTEQLGIASTVDVVLSNGTASSGFDFTPGPITVRFAVGETTKMVPIEILGDDLAESNETVILSLANFSDGGLTGSTQPTATLTIQNDDFAPVAIAALDQVFINEGDGLFLDATRTTDADSSALTYRWDVDGDGDFDENITGVALSLSASQLAALGLDDGPNGPITVILEVSDGTNADTDSKTFFIQNVKPSFDLGPNDTLFSGSGLFLRDNIPFADPGNDTWTGTVDYGDGSGEQPLSIDQVNRTFTLNHTYSADGTYTISVNIKDDDNGSMTDTYDLEVRLNTPPEAKDDSFHTNEDISIQLDVLADNGNGADSDQQNNIDVSKTTAISQPAKGLLTAGSNGVFTFDPDGQFEQLAKDATEDVTFDYEIQDDFGEKSSATVTITVIGVNDPPTVSDETAMASEDGAAVTIGTASGDVDSDDDASSLNYEILSQTSEGSVTVNGDGSFEFDPGSDFQDLAQGETREVSFTYRATDRQGANSDIGTITITVIGGNDDPTVSDETATASEDGAAVTIGTASGDVDSDDDASSLSYRILSQPTEGWVTVKGDGSFEFDPGSDFQDLAQGETRDVSFTYQAADRHGADSNVGTITITVVGVNDAPTVVSPLADVTVDEDAEDLVLDVSSTFGDVDQSDTLVLSVSASNLGLVNATIEGTSLRLGFLANQSGTSLITLTATDPFGQSISITFQLSVLSAEEQTDNLIEQINEFVNTGDLNDGGGTALIATLANAQKKLEDGKEKVAINTLNAFINQVQDQLDNGDISEDLATSLIDAANRIIQSAG